MWNELMPFLGILLAAALSTLIGIEREFFAKAAGMRTYALVGTGSALFTTVGEFGFTGSGALDGSRVAAQVVSGIGFLGAGLIFFRRNYVRGLTTAAGIWYVAAVGMAAGAGLYTIACLATVLYLALMVGMRPLHARMPHAKSTVQKLTIDYLDGRGVLRDLMESLSALGVKVIDLHVLESQSRGEDRIQSIKLSIEGTEEILSDVPDELSRVSGVTAIATE